MEEVNVNISVMKGDKLFNENAPFAINIFAPESKDMKNRSNADLICLIDISGSMAGAKINLVKQSLKVLVKLMDKTDRICIILFNDSAKNFFNLNYLTDEIKNKLYDIIDNIKAEGGTSIMSGLEIAVDVLINDKDKEKPNRASSILLLSDGCDNEYNDIALVEKLRNLTKNKDLNFTLNSFGYGGDHDPQTMKKLSNIRDGTFFYVDKYENVAEFFGIVLGTCASVISNKASLVVELLNKKCEIKKIFGEEYLYTYDKDKDSNYFTTTMLQFIYGKEFTYVLELDLKSNELKEGEDLILIDFMYQDYEKNFHKIRVTYKYTLNDANKSKANKEYIRSQVYDVIDKSLKMKKNSQNEEAKAALNEMKNWLVENNQIYQDSNRDGDNLFLNDINLALKFCDIANNNNNKNNHNNNNIYLGNDIDNYSYIETKYQTKIESEMTCKIMSNIKKNSSSTSNIYTNYRQELYSSDSKRTLETVRENSSLKKREEYDFEPTNKNKKKKCIIF